MKHQSNDYPFLVRNAAPIALFLVGFAALAIGFVVPDSWKPFENVEDARWFGVFGLVPFALGCYLWRLCNPKNKYRA